MEAIIGEAILKDEVIGDEILDSSVSIVTVPVSQHPYVNNTEGSAERGEKKGGLGGNGTSIVRISNGTVVQDGLSVNGGAQVLGGLSLEEIKGTSDEGVSLLNSETVALRLADESEVLQLQMQSGIECGNLNTEPRNDEASEVILIYQDLLTCGACSKQYVDMAEFLEHKTQHTIASSFHKCDLCHGVFKSEPSVVEHYQDYHRVNIFREAGKFEENDQNGNDTQGPGFQGNEKPHEKQETKTMIDINDIINGSKNVPIEAVPLVCKKSPQSQSRQKSSINKSGRQKNGQTPQSGIIKSHISDPLSNRSFETFSPEQCHLNTALRKGVSLLKNSVKTESKTTPPCTNIKLPNRFFTCLHCKFETSAKASMSKHMKAKHPKLIVQHKKEEEERNMTKTDPEGVSSVGKEIEDKLISDSSNDESSTPKSDFNFILQTEMVKGNSLTYDRTWFKCLHCDFKASTKSGISKHMHRVHADILNMHKYESLDLKELAGNEKGKVMKMSAYETLFGKESRFRRRPKKKNVRVLKQDLLGAYSCTTCGKVFSRLRYLRKHNQTHRTERRYLCDECGKSFKSRTYLSVHRRIHREKIFRCNQCDFKSKINAAIHAHRQVHSQGSVLCDICGYAYTDKATLSKHKRVHDLNRPFTCNFPGCTWRFKTEVMCKAHIRAHTTEGKFKCSYCGYLFRHKHHLQRHETSMHGVKHTKSRVTKGNRTKKKPETITRKSLDVSINPKTIEAVNIIMDEDNRELLQLSDGDGLERHLVVATDTQGTPITFEGADLTALNVAYQTLLQNQDSAGDGRTLIMAQPDTQIIFKQEY